MMYVGLCFLFQIFNFRGPLVYQFYYCHMLPSLNKVLLTYLLTMSSKKDFQSGQRRKLLGLLKREDRRTKIGNFI